MDIICLAEKMLEGEEEEKVIVIIRTGKLRFLGPIASGRGIIYWKRASVQDINTWIKCQGREGEMGHSICTVSLSINRISPGLARLRWIVEVSLSYETLLLSLTLWKCCNWHGKRSTKSINSYSIPFYIWWPFFHDFTKFALLDPFLKVHQGPISQNGDICDIIKQN